MSDFLSPVSEAEETLSFNIPAGQPERKSKYFFAPGKYRARCVDLTQGTTVAGDPKVVLEFLILEGPGEGTSMRRHLPVTAKMFWLLDKTAQAFGITTPKGSTTIGLSRSKIVGQDVVLELVHTDFNNKDKMDIRNVLPAEAKSSAPF